MKVVGYVRLSRDEDKENYSSILSQKTIIEECAQQYGWKISRFYEDDNCSGYTFDRPGLSELVRDLENDEIDVIIAKDLSRIGRHNAQTLLFIDKIKHLNKRMILPQEGRGYDTAEDENDLLGITTWYNEMYVKDISRKIRSSIKAKQREGRLIIREVFGYKRSSSDKHKLEIDLEAASIVQKIFSLYLSGMGYRKIAEILNSEHYPTPSQYNARKSGDLKSSKLTASQWNSVHVQRILKNDVYTGTLRLAKTVKKTIKGKSQKQPIEQQLIFENNHPAIISKETFEEVQKISSSRQKNYSKGAASLNNIFSGIIKCQDCGSYMIAYSRKGKPKSYICGKYHKYGKKGCTRHGVQEEFIKESVVEHIKAMVSHLRDEIDRMNIEVKSDSYIDAHRLKNKLEQERQQCKEQLKLLIMQKITELKKDNCSEYQNITEESFCELEDDLKKRLLYLDKRIRQLEQEKLYSDSQCSKKLEKIISEIIDKSKLNKKDIEILIDNILIDEKGNSTIYLKADFRPICNHIQEDVNLVPDQ